MKVESIVKFRSTRWQLPHVVGHDTVDYHPDVQDWGPIVVPRDSLFVMGDNRENSLDSRYWGFLPRENLRGSPMFIYFSYDPESYRAYMHRHLFGHNFAVGFADRDAIAVRRPHHDPFDDSLPADESLFAALEHGQQLDMGSKAKKGRRRHCRDAPEPIIRQARGAG